MKRYLWETPIEPTPAVYSSKHGTTLIEKSAKKTLFKAYFQCKTEGCREYYINFVRKKLVNFPDLFERVNKEIADRHQELQQAKRFKCM